MTDTEAALLRAVCEAPDDDLPRLVYADWLDENGQGERAEWIRSEISHGKSTSWPSGRKPEIVWCDSESLVTVMPDGSRKVHGDSIRSFDIAPAIIGVSWTVRRGFPDAVTLTMSQFMGGACECQRFDDIDRQSWIASSTRCKCRGTGQTPGLARELFERWPITRVRLSDRESIRIGDTSSWYVREKIVGNFHTGADDIPFVIGRLLRGFMKERGKQIDREPQGVFLDYPTPEAAHAALSDAAVAYGRGLVGLSELP